MWKLAQLLELLEKKLNSAILERKGGKSWIVCDSKDRSSPRSESEKEGDADGTQSLLPLEKSYRPYFWE